MRRRNRRKTNHSSQNLDSFLDILTNTVGVLMFISLFVTLFAVEAETIVRTPLSSKTEKTPRFFEIRDNKVTYVDDEQVGAEIEQLMGSLPACHQPQMPEGLDFSLYNYYSNRMQDYRDCISSRARRLTNFQTQTSHYNVTLVNPGSFSLLYEPIPNAFGETKEEIETADSDFKQIMSELNPNKDYLAFIVRPDSFSTFRSAREQAWALGFDVGWEPQKKNAPIIFGSGGRNIGVQ